MLDTVLNLGINDAVEKALAWSRARSSRAIPAPDLKVAIGASY
ncbi:hypothetical protein I552_2259 [Mycobacterium xenopi 3993]|nr:hypothetical protein I552_2259 [Mycobacterium xenopi 3993]